MSQTQPITAVINYTNKNICTKQYNVTTNTTTHNITTTSVFFN